MAKRTTLHSPDGRTYETSDPTEITRLKARGYREQAPTKTKASTSSQTKSTSS